MTFTEITLNAQAKAANATALECQRAIKDCHETLEIGQYDFRSDYAIKLWAEIDAYRDRAHALARSAK
jgi:hypothetical protein